MVSNRNVHNSTNNSTSSSNNNANNKPTATSSSSSSKRKQSAPKPKLKKMCDKCDYGTNEISEFIEHMKLEHNLDDIHFCDECSFYTGSFWDYQVHMQEHLET